MSISILARAKVTSSGKTKEFISEHLQPSFMIADGKAI